MSEKIGELFIEIKAKMNQFEQDLNSIKSKVTSTAKEVEPKLNFKTRFDGSMAKLSLEELKALSIRLQTEFQKKISLNVDSGSIERTKQKMQSVEDRLQGITKEAKTATDASNNIGTMLKTAFTAVGGMVLLSKALDFAKKIISINTEFEELRTRLVSLYGTTEKAADVFEQFRKIAADTPYSVKQVVEAGASIKAFGMDAEKTIQPVADLAAFMGINVVEAAGAVGRAFAGGVGAADILRERGVLNLIKSFKGVDDLTKLTLPQFRKALLDTMVDPAAGIVGSTERLSKTFGGLVSNMGDAMENFIVKIGTTLMPILTPLVKKATTLFGMLSTSAAEEFEAVSKSVANTEKNIVPLIDVIDDLSEKTNLSKQEHATLAKAITTVASTFPAAITEWDKYGHAIAVSTSRLKDLIAAEKARLQYTNAKALKELYTDYAKVNGEMLNIEKKLKDNTKFTQTYNYGTGQYEDSGKEGYTDEEKSNLNNRLIELGNQKMGMEKQHAYLTGQDIKVPEGTINIPNVNSSGTGKGKDIINQRRNAEFEAKDSHNKWLEAQIADEYEQKKKVIEDEKALNKEKLQAEEKDKITYDSRLSSIEDDYKTKMFELDKDHEEKKKKLAEETLNKKLAWDKEYTTLSERIEKDNYDVMISNYTLSESEYKDYLSRMLNLKMQALQEENRKIEENNKKNGTNYPLIDIGYQTKQGEDENAVASKKYNEGKKDKEKKKWEKEHKMLVDVRQSAVDSMTSGWETAFNKMVNISTDSNNAIIQGAVAMANAFSQQIARMLAEWLAIKAITGLFGTFSGGEGGVALTAEGALANSGNLGALGNIKPIGGGGGGAMNNVPLVTDINRVMKNSKSNNSAVNNNDVVSALSKVNSSIQVMNMNIVSGSSNKQQQIELSGKLNGKDIYLANKKLSKIINRNY